MHNSYITYTRVEPLSTYIFLTYILHSVYFYRFTFGILQWPHESLRLALYLPDHPPFCTQGLGVILLIRNTHHHLVDRKTREVLTEICQGDIGTHNQLGGEHFLHGFPISKLIHQGFQTLWLQVMRKQHPMNLGQSRMTTL